jgi:protein-S-isoprenylcysteine O-methyltransferase Ste14
MNIWFGKIVFIVGFLVFGYFRHPHVKRNKTVKTDENRKGGLDIALIVFAAIGSILLPFLWIAFDIFPFADFQLYPAAFAIGVVFLVSGLWIFYRSHGDLGTNWSTSLELRQNHQLVKHGVYRLIRHPMYTSLFLYSAAQAFLLPNEIVGPAAFVTFAVLYFCRVGDEEKMMLDRFGADYALYMKLSKRLIPHIW